jgi:HSP20 family molecular chaperone IbpA
MTESKKVSKQATEKAAAGKAIERPIRPAVDIFEDDTGITVQADLPGVTREHLDIQIDRDNLAIEGKADIPMPKGLEAIYADVQSTHYQRSFTLSHELEGEKAEASLKDGVLTLRIPKREQYQPRKIEVSIS